METKKRSLHLQLNFVGTDYFVRPIYKDQYKNLWKDIDLGDSKKPNLYSVANNCFEGEPMSPIPKDYTFEILSE